MMNEKEVRQNLEATATRTEQTGRVESEDSAAILGQIMWVGGYSTCGKHLKHYESFRINGVTIPVRSFCYIMIEKEGRNVRLVAYIVDLYEDNKSHKKMRVKWLHKSKEIEDPIPSPEPFENELFMTRSTQVIVLECCDGVVYVLTPNHFEASKSTLTSSGEHVYVCGRLFDEREGFKPYDISAVEGYWNQKIFFSRYVPQILSDIARANTNFHKDEQTGSVHAKKSGIKAPRSARRRPTGRYDPSNDEGDWTPQQESCRLSYDVVNAVTSSAVNLLNVFRDTDSGGSSAGLGQDDLARVGNKVEILSQDSGMKGCWFRCTVLETHLSLNLKVRYDDVFEVDTEKPLEEWVSVNKVAPAEKLEFRISGRQMMRPLPPELEKLSAHEQGFAVDVWGGEGWWEGIFIGRNASGQVKVAFPAEEYADWFDESEVRVSREWVDGQWLAVRPDANIRDRISGLHIKGLASSQVQEFCPANDRAVCPEFLSGLEAASQFPNLGAEAREEIRPGQAVHQPIATTNQANNVLVLHYERPSTNQAFLNTSGKVKANLKSAARQTSTREPTFSECEGGIKLSNHYSKSSAESSFVGRSEDLNSHCFPANSSRSVLADNGNSQPAELQQLDVDRDNKNNTHVVDMPSGGSDLFSKMSRKRNRDADSLCFARSTNSGLCGSRDPPADLLSNPIQEQEDASVGVFTLNKLTEIGNVEAKCPQYGFDQVNSSSGASVGGPLFNSVSVQNLVLSR